MKDKGEYNDGRPDRCCAGFARSVWRAALIIAMAGTFLSRVASTSAQVNGNSVITAPVFGLPLTIRTSSQYAGAISSLQWGGKEFINNWDHGRQLQFNAEYFNRYECYNPYEAGSKDDNKAPTSSSRLLSLTASGSRLETLIQMAWYLPTRETRPGAGDYCGDPADWLPCPPYTGPLSNYQVHKSVSIGFAGIPNVIEFFTDLYIPEQVQKGIDQIAALTPYEFSSVWTYDLVSNSYRKIRLLNGEDDAVKVIATADGSYAMGFYSPELLQPYSPGSSTNRWSVVPPDPLFRDPNDPTRLDPDFACVALGSVSRYESFSGPGDRQDRGYFVIGNLDQVRDGLASLHFQFRALDPDVFNWRDYVVLNHLEAALPSQAAAESHWLTYGISEGRAGSYTFWPSQYLQLNPDLTNVFGATNYQAAIDHYIGFGRKEGRSTVAKPAAGMQHLLTLTNGSVDASGQNVFGQFGNGTTASTSTATDVATLNHVTEIAAGDYTSLSVKSDGTLWVSGSNQYGARGNGTTGGINITRPVKVPLPNRVSTPTRGGKHAVAVGTAAYAVIDTEGQVWTWGANWNGRLGDGTTTSRYTPARVRKSSKPNDYLTGIVSIAAGGGTMAAIDADGTVWTWGAGAKGALGNGSTRDSSHPVQVVAANGHNGSAPLIPVTEVACGSSGFCIALSRYGQVFGWGSNEFSQLGIAPGGALSIATPIRVGAFIDAISAGSAHCIAHGSNGKVYGWGYNGRGQLGTGFPTVAQFPPIAMSPGPDGMGDIGDLAAGAGVSVMVRHWDRAIFVTGDNQSGQLGIPGNQPAQYVPVKSSF